MESSKADETLSRGWQEYGSVTGRLRRAAPFNFELGRRSARLNSATQLAITKLDAIYPDVSRAKDFGSLSKPAREFIYQIEKELKTPVAFIGTGPDAEDIIDRRGSEKV